MLNFNGSEFVSISFVSNFWESYTLNTKNPKRMDDFSVNNFFFARIKCDAQRRSNNNSLYFNRYLKYTNECVSKVIRYRWSWTYVRKRITYISAARVRERERRDSLQFLSAVFSSHIMKIVQFGKSIIAREYTMRKMKCKKTTNWCENTNTFTVDEHKYEQMRW